MPFPNTIDAAVGGAEQPGKFSTFLHGTDRYQIQFTLDSMAGTATLMAMKSPDGGATWAEVDSANHPVGQYNGSGSIFPYTCVQTSATTLYVFYLDLGGADIAIIAFDMSTDSWALSTVTFVPPFGAYTSSGEGNFPLGQYVIAYRPGLNDIVFVSPSDGVTLDDVPHSICWAASYDIAGASVSTLGDLGYQDYSDITTWDMIPCGIAHDSTSGITTVLMQQVTRAGPGSSQTTSFNASGTWNVPLDAGATAEVERIGAGGGATAGVGGQGAGGGGAYNRSNAVAIVPGAANVITVGVGGAAGADGGDTTALGATAKGGKHGAAGVGGLGGAATGGDVAFAGGNGGGDGGTANGGGGGGSGLSNATGGNGQDGQPGLNPPQAAGGSGSGNGGGGGTILIVANGEPGIAPGGGGGGGTNVGLGGAGADGTVLLAWTSVRNTNDCRMWQQAIMGDNSLGTLTEITQGAYPSRAKGAAPVPISFDAAIRNGVVAISLTGATSTSGRDNISVGSGASADPVAFTFTSFSCGNGGNNVDSCPAVAMGSLGTFCCYISAPDGSDIGFLYRLDAGSGFGSPVTIGSLASPDDREFSRVQASVLVTAPEITFGIPTSGELDFNINT